MVRYQRYSDPERNGAMVHSKIPAGLRPSRPGPPREPPEGFPPSAPGGADGGADEAIGKSHCITNPGGNGCLLPSDPEGRLKLESSDPCGSGRPDAGPICSPCPLIVLHNEAVRQ